MLSLPTDDIVATNRLWRNKCVDTSIFSFCIVWWWLTVMYTKIFQDPAHRSNSAQVDGVGRKNVFDLQDAGRAKYWSIFKCYLFIDLWKVTLDNSNMKWIGLDILVSYCISFSAQYRDLTFIHTHVDWFLCTPSWCISHCRRQDYIYIAQA